MRTREQMERWSIESRFIAVSERGQTHESRQRTLFRLHKRVSYNVLQGKAHKGVTRQSINRSFRIVDTPIRHRGLQKGK